MALRMTACTALGGVDVHTPPTSRKPARDTASTRMLAVNHSTGPVGKRQSERGRFRAGRAASSGSFRRWVSGHPVAGPMGALALGLEIRLAGNLDAARQALQQAIDSGHASAAPQAAHQMAVLLVQQGRLAEACTPIAGVTTLPAADQAAIRYRPADQPSATR